MAFFSKQKRSSSFFKEGRRAQNSNAQSPCYHLHSLAPHDANLGRYHNTVLAFLNKNALQSAKDEERQFSRGTTFIRRSLTAPTLQVLLYLARSRGQTGEFYSRASTRFLLAARSLFRRRSTYGLSTNRPLSGCNAPCYSSP